MKKSTTTLERVIHTLLGRLGFMIFSGKARGLLRFDGIPFLVGTDLWK